MLGGFFDRRRELLGATRVYKKRTIVRRLKITRYFGDIDSKTFLKEDNIDLIDKTGYVGCAKCKKIYTRAYMNLLGFWNIDKTRNALGGVYVFGFSNVKVNKKDKIDKRGTYSFLLYFLREIDLEDSRYKHKKRLLKSLENAFENKEFENLISKLVIKDFELRDPVLFESLIKKAEYL